MDKMIFIFIGVLLLVSCIKYKEGLENTQLSDPQTQSHEHQGSIQNFHETVEELKKTLTPTSIDDLTNKIKNLNDQTYTLQKNIPDRKVIKYMKP